MLDEMIKTATVVEPIDSRVIVVCSLVFSIQNHTKQTQLHKS